MWELIVLGEVPGTSLQVSFETWLGLVGAVMLVASYLYYRVRGGRTITAMLLGVLATIRQARQTRRRLAQPTI